MQRLMQIKEKLDVIEAALAEQYPRFRPDPVITDLVTELKDHVQEERKKIQKQHSRGQLSEFERCFIEPAINDVYLSSIDKIRRGSKPSGDMNFHICDTSSTLSYWLFQIKDHVEK
ncbi:TPA: hypothetical protein U5E00_003396 [Yersinia enterocolitica]|uniref:hypothetical protein n=1 Tax=Yersinia TaxID=629 RepID=UPI0005E4A541|nr:MULTISPECIES: hypothetical protein [Yersinia]ELI8278898.1 hypothetical protein [Yersinia enterocolitica]MBW5814420.1 hypothetical protein [Yersinia kristensenii]MBW5831675.1 hypothetical protein [Yersinia kristensenii]CNH15678.1 Uncharacterised protein [Yersinia intermedia]CQD77863.1 Uncharacterised protein [Yersinia intermedia]